MKKSVGQKIRLGIFIVLGTLLLVSGLYFIGNRQNLFGKNIRLNAMFSNVNGLQLGNNVRFSGIDVGTVSKIGIINDTLILVEMVIRENAGGHIKKDAVATIGSDGLVGNMIVNIIPREGKTGLVKDRDTIKTYSRIATDDMLTTLNVTNQNAALLTADLLEITNAILEGDGTISMLLNDTVAAKDLKATMRALRNTSRNAAEATEELNDLIGSFKSGNSMASRLITDSIMGTKLDEIMNNLHNSSKDVNKITTNLDSLVSRMKSSRGAMYYLTENEDLVKNLDTTLINIKESSIKFNENMDALKKNFLLRGYFNKQERQAKRAAKKEARENQ